MDFLPPLIYARQVGGSSTHFTANYWRFHGVDFKERSLLGPIAGTGFPIWFAAEGLPADVPTWGRDYKRMLGAYFTRTVTFNGHTMSLAFETNNIFAERGEI